MNSNARQNIPMPTAGGLFQRVQEIDFLADLECKELKVEIDKIQNKTEPAVVDRYSFFSSKFILISEMIMIEFKI